MAQPARAALIVGTSRGLGARFVQQYLARNWRVVGTIRGNPPPRTDDTGPEILRLDVTREDEIAALRQKLADRRFDLLLVNAGVTNDPSTTMGEVTTDEFVHVMATNVLGPLRCLDAFGPLVHERGTLAVLSSGLGSISDNTHGGWEVYRASKAALNMAVRSYAARREGKQTILAIAPGWSRTDMGGPTAPLDPGDSVRGVVATLEKLAGSGKRAFVDYRGGIVPW